VALTDKQQRFVAEYLIDLNATQAAMRAARAKGGLGGVDS
jgi:phage terminase small subunit